MSEAPNNNKRTLKLEQKEIKKKAKLVEESANEEVSDVIIDESGISIDFI